MCALASALRAVVSGHPVLDTATPAALVALETGVRRRVLTLAFVRNTGRPSTVGLNLDPGEVSEGGLVGAHYGAGGRPRRRGDDEVVGSARPPLASNVNEQLGMSLSDRTVVVEEGDDL